MTEHEKLKEIIDLIGFDILKINSRIEYTKFYGFYIDGGELYWKTYDIREIIFTPEFMEKFISYCDINGIIAPSYYKIFLIDLHKNLNNPIDYIYNLIKE